VSNLLSPTGEFPAFNPSARQVLPASAAHGPAFNHVNAAIIREAMDLIDSYAATKRPARLSCEAIVLEGASVVSTYTNGGRLVASRRLVCNFTVEQPLEIAPDPVPFVAVVPTLQAEAAQALDRLATQSIKARRRAAIVVPARQSPVVWVATVMAFLAVGAAVLAAWR